MQRGIEILGIPVIEKSSKDTITQIIELSALSQTHLIMTPNAEIVYLANRDPEFKKVLLDADILIPDGSGLQWAARFLGHPLPGRMTGIEIMTALLQHAHLEHRAVFLLGSHDKVVQKAAHLIREQWPGISECGYHHGYFDQIDNQYVLDQINRIQPTYLFVGMGAPRQEKWMRSNKNQLKVAVVMGVGGSFDVYSGQLARAPDWVQKIGLEWLYRFLQEPKRANRIMTLPRFVIAVIGHRKRISGRK